MLWKEFFVVINYVYFLFGEDDNKNNNQKN